MNVNEQHPTAHLLLQLRANLGYANSIININIIIITLCKLITKIIFYSMIKHDSRAVKFSKESECCRGSHRTHAVEIFGGILTVSKG